MSAPRASQTVTTPPRPAWLRPRVPWAVKALVAVGLLTWVFLEVPLTDIATSLRGARLLPVAGAFLLVLGGAWLSALRLRTAGLQLGLRLRARSVLGVNLAASFYGLFLPGYLSSGAIRWHKLSVLADRRPGVLAAMVYSRLNFLVVLVLLGLGALALDARRNQHHGAALGLVALLALAVSVHVLAFRGALLRALQGATPPRRRWLPRWLSLQARQFLRVSSRFRRLRSSDRVRIWGLSLLENVAGIASVWLLTRALGQDLDVVAVAWITAIIQIASEVPISIAGLGIREGGLVLLLRPLGIPAGPAVALSLLMFARTIFLGFIGGAIEASALARGPDSRIRDGA